MTTFWGGLVIGIAAGATVGYVIGLYVMAVGANAIFRRRQ